MINIILISGLSVSINCFCQSTATDCNRSSRTPQLLKRIPTEICISKGYEFIFDHEPSDMTEDGFNDKIIEFAE